MPSEEPVRGIHTALLAVARLMDSKTLQLDSPLGIGEGRANRRSWQVRINGKQFVVTMRST